MSSVNIGNQKVRHHWTSEVNSDDVMNLTREELLIGIYSGLELSKESTVSARCSSGIVKIADINGKAETNVEFQESFVLSLSEEAPYFCLRWEYKESSVDIYVEILALARDSILETDIVVGKAIFVAGEISYFNYCLRSEAPSYKINLTKKWFKVIPDDPYSNKVKVESAQFISDKLQGFGQILSGVFSVPVNNKRVDLLIVKDDGSLLIEEGIESANPMPNDYRGRFVIAEIYRYVGQTNIYDEDIKKVEWWIPEIKKNVEINNIKVKGNIEKIKNNKGGVYENLLFESWSGSQTGTIVISTNITFSQWDLFLNGRLRIFNNSKEYIFNFSFYINGSGNQFLNCDYIREKGEKIIRFKTCVKIDLGKVALVLGETTTNWINPCVIIEYIDVQYVTGDIRYLDNLFRGWESYITTSVLNATKETYFIDKNNKIGLISAYIYNNVPDTLLADGSVISKVSNPLYTELIDFLKTEAGEDTSHPYYHSDSDKAVLPDLRGRIIRGVDGVGLYRDKDGVRKSGNYQSDDNKEHTHSISGSTENATTGISASTNPTGAHTHTITDPGHRHRVCWGSQGNSAGAYNKAHTTQTDFYTLSSTTGISINSGGAHSHTVSITDSGHNHSISFDAGYTGSAEVTVKNISLYYRIFY